jgi:hypothetical protein
MYSLILHTFLFKFVLSHNCGIKDGSHVVGLGGPCVSSILVGLDSAVIVTDQF